MNAIERVKKLGVIEHYIAQGCTEFMATMAAGVSLAWYKRNGARFAEEGIEGLRDQPRPGRPRKQS